jgi:hypothetical protein
MSKQFNPDDDIPDLSGKVIFISGGKGAYKNISVALTLPRHYGFRKSLPLRVRKA